MSGLEPAALRAVDGAEYDAVWDRFAARFSFRPGVRPKDWPAIAEPAGSVTWSLGAALPSLRRDRLNATVRRGLAACTPPGGTVLVLDWQHPCFRVRPDRIGDGWPLEIYPDGDYYAHLSEDLGLGCFGHPWERSLCVFGADLLERVAPALDRLLPSVLRRDGVAVR